jgi:hypothetical protein
MAIGKRIYGAPAAEGGERMLNAQCSMLNAESILAAQAAEGFVQVAAVTGLLREESNAHE